jgi:hypothetical protein
VGDNKNRRRTDFPCRSVYLPVIRNDLPEIFDVFDFANPHTATGLRPQTTVATQGLFMLNDALVMDAATATARRLLESIPEGASDGASDEAPDGTPDDAKVDRRAVARMYALVLNAEPTDAEREMMLTFIQQASEQFKGDGDSEARLRAWALAVHALFASSRFQIVE